MSQIQACALAAVRTFPNVTVHTPQGAVNLRILMVAIAGHESGWVATAQGDYGLGGPNCHGYTSWGFWQVHNVWGTYLEQVTHSTNPCTWYHWLSIPANAAAAAWHIYQTQGLDAWNPDIQGGAWLRYQAQAAAAVQAVSGRGTSTATPPATAHHAPGGSSGTAPQSPASPAGPTFPVLLVAGAVAIAALAWGASTVL